MSSYEINIKQLAKDFLDTFPLYIWGNELAYDNRMSETIIEFLEENVAHITPAGHIILEGSLAHLEEELMIYVAIDIQKRINTIIRNYQKEEQRNNFPEIFKIEVEKDGN